MIGPAAVVPHAPVLLPELSVAGHESTCAELRSAVSKLAWGAAETVVVLSPHGERRGVYASLEGSLDGFGVHGVGGSFPADDTLAAVLARTAGLPLLDGRVDHGVLVPALLGCGAGRPLVGISLDGSGGSATPSPAATPGAVAEALGALGARIGIAASAHGGAALSAGAPLTELPGAVDAEKAWLAAVTHDAALLGVEASRLAAVAGSCGARPLHVVADLCRGRRGSVATYASPFGVGYLVASFPQP